jgi:hypothetical protein
MANRESDSGQIEAIGAPEMSEQFEVVAGAAPAVEDPEARSATGGLLQQRRDEVTEASEPEVLRLGTRRGAKQMVHEGAL